MTFFKRIAQAALVAAFFLSSVQAQSPDYIRHPASLPCASNTYVQTLGSTSATQATCATIPNAAADGSTKGIATFTASDFDSSSGLISLDYANGQKATTSLPGFLTAADWNTFNGKQAAGNYITALTGDVTASGPGSAAATVAKINGATLGTTTATSGNLLIGSGTAWVTNAMSGDVTINSTGVTAIGSNKVTLAKLATQADQTALVNISGGTAVPTASTFDAAKIQRFYFASSTSGTSTYTATLSPVPTGYQTGAQYVVTVTSTNTGASTMNFNSLGAKTMQLNGSALAAGQLQAGATYQMVYDGTNLQISGQAVATTSPLTTKGDLFIYSTANTRHAVSPLNGNVLVADSTQTDGRAEVFGVVDGSLGAFWQDDFEGGLSLTTGLGGATLIGSKSAVKTVGTNSATTHGSTATVPAGQVGTVTMDTGTTTTGRAGVFGGWDNVATQPLIKLGTSGQIEVTLWFGTYTTASNGTDRYNMTGGLTDGLAGRGNNSIQFYSQDNQSSGAFNILVDVGGVQQTLVAGTTIPSTNSNYAVKLIIDSARTKVDMYVTPYGTAFPASPEATYSGTLPASTVFLLPYMEIVKVAGTNNRLMYADMWQLAYRTRR